MKPTTNSTNRGCDEKPRRTPSLVALLVGAVMLLGISYGEARFIERAPTWDGGAVVCLVDKTSTVDQGADAKRSRHDSGVPVAVLH